MMNVPPGIQTMPAGVGPGSSTISGRPGGTVGFRGSNAASTVEVVLAVGATGTTAAAGIASNTRIRTKPNINQRMDDSESRWEPRIGLVEAIGFCRSQQKERVPFG